MNPSTPDAGDARRVVVGASLTFAFVLLLATWVLLRVRGLSVVTLFSADAWLARTMTGCALGIAAGCVCLAAVRMRRFAGLRRLAADAVEGLEPRWHTVLFVSLAAGVSEEAFFRGALEPAAGIVISTIAFVALHGALRWRARRTPVLAVFLTVASLGLSALCARQGLEAAIAAHTLYDATVLAGLLAAARRSSP